MKRCPTCQQTYPDYGPDQCTNDGTRLISDVPSQPQYYAGGQQAPPYATPGNQPPAPQWPPPAQNWGGGYQQPQPGQYAPPYGSPYAPVGGSRALSTAAFLCGLGSFIILVLIILFYVMARNGALDFSTLLFLARIMQPLSWLMLLAGVASIVIGIISLVMSGKNPALSKAKAIVGMCLGAIPLMFFIIGLANMPR